MTAWTDAIDAQLATLDAYVTGVTERKTALQAETATATGQRLDQINAVLLQIDQILFGRSEWRAKLVEARSLGYLPDTNTRFYEDGVT